MFWSLGYHGVQGSGWRGHACVKSLPRVGAEVCPKFGGDWSGRLSVKRGHRYKQSLLYIDILAEVHHCENKGIKTYIINSNLGPHCKILRFKKGEIND